MIELLKKIASNKNSLKLILLFGFIIRILYAVYAHSKNIMTSFSDDIGYWDYAKNVISQGPFVMNPAVLDETAKIVGPGIAWIDAIPILLFGQTWLPIFLLNCIVSTFTIYLIYLIAKEITLNDSISVFAAIVSSVYIYFLKYIPTSGKEVWMAFFFTLVFYMILKLRHRRDHWTIYTIVLAFLFTFFIHIDERYLAYAPLFIIFIILLDKTGKSKGFKKATIFTLFVLAFMTPWLIRNYIVYHRPIIVTLRTATITDKLFGYPKQEYWDERSRWYMTPSEIDSVIAGTRTTTHLGLPVSQEQLDAMRNGIIPYQFTPAETMWNSFKALWQPIDIIRWNYVQDGYRFDHVLSVKNNLSVFLTYGIMLIFAFYGIVLIKRYDKKLFYFFIGIFLLHTIIHVLLIPFTEYRYRIPIDATIIVLGSLGLITCISYLSKKKISTARA